MAKKRISIGLSEKDIDRAIKELEQYKRELDKKLQRFTEGLAMLGLREASIRFTTAMYDGVNDVSVWLNKSGNAYVIEAKGEAVAFIEFGSGVYHNTSESQTVSQILVVGDRRGREIDGRLDQYLVCLFGKAFCHAR